MDKVDKLKTFLKATLPIVEEPDMDVVIGASLALAAYYVNLSKKEEVTDEQFLNACALIVAGFNGDTIHYLEECIEDFKEEVWS